MLTDKQRRVIEAALRHADRHGLVLGGSAALAAHGLPGFSAKKVDLLCTRDSATQTGKATRAVERELRRAGYAPERTDNNPVQRRLSVPVAEMLAQWHVPTGDRHDHPPINGITRYQCHQCSERVYLELINAQRIREPERTPLGPVARVEDAAGTRVRDLAERSADIDYRDTARLLEHWSPRQLTGFACRLDPTLDPRDIDRAAERLLTLPDHGFGLAGTAHPELAARLREQFATWQRDPRDITRRAPARQREHPEPARETRHRPDDPAREHPQQTQPVPTLQPRAQPQRQAPARQRERRKPERDEQERSR